MLKQKRFKNYLICLFFLLFIQYGFKFSFAKELRGNVSSEVYLVSIFENKTPFQNTANQSTQANKQKKTVVDTIFTLDLRLTYVPSVQTCLYIRTSPNISDSNIIQCLIPEKSEDHISGMWHKLRPTGKTDGDWAEFWYSFEVYTSKPDIPENDFFREWQKKRDRAHKFAKKKYRTIRKKGWIKFRNEDGTPNIVIPMEGC